MNDTCISIFICEKIYDYIKHYITAYLLKNSMLNYVINRVLTQSWQRPPPGRE